MITEPYSNPCRSEQRDFVPEEMRLPFTLPIRQTAPVLTATLVRMPHPAYQVTGHEDGLPPFDDVNLQTLFGKSQAESWNNPPPCIAGTLPGQTHTLGAETVLFDEGCQSHKVPPLLLPCN